VRPQRIRDPHQRAGRAEPLAERGHSPSGLLPDLAAEALTMVGDDVRVVELVGGVVAGPFGELGGSGNHVVDVPGGDLRSALDRRHDLELRAERAHQLEPLLSEAVGDHDQGAIALRATHERECGTGAPARVLDDGVAGRDQSVSFGALDHRERHPVLHRPRRIAVLELQPHLGAVRGHTVAQADERRVSDRLEDRLHAWMIAYRATPLRPSPRAVPPEARLGPGSPARSRPRRRERARARGRRRGRATSAG
jgi:hypothetical protein